MVIAIAILGGIRHSGILPDQQIVTESGDNMIDENGDLLVTN